MLTCWSVVANIIPTTTPLTNSPKLSGGWYNFFSQSSLQRDRDKTIKSRTDKNDVLLSILYRLPLVISKIYLVYNIKSIDIAINEL